MNKSNTYFWDFYFPGGDFGEEVQPEYYRKKTAAITSSNCNLLPRRGSTFGEESGNVGIKVFATAKEHRILLEICGEDINPTRRTDR